MKVYVLLIIIITAIGSLAFTSQRGGAPGKGKTLFEENCAKCHGADGTRGKFGAANLRTSVMPEEAIIERIEKGKRFMPSFKKRFTPEEIRDLAGYVKTLRSN
jgi:cytochrome c6